MKALLKYLFITIAVFTVAASANAQNFAGGKRPTNLRTIEERVRKEILKLPNYGLFDHITYQVSDGTVVLGGSTISLGTRKGAERVVKRIPGIELVVNNIRELPPSPYDGRIRQELYRTLASTGGLSRYLWEPNPSVRLIVDRGRVSLEGFVDRRADADTMYILSRGVFGVFDVKNNLIVNSELAG